MNTVNTARAFCYLAGAFRHQQTDPVCGSCKAWVNSVNATREKLAAVEAAHAADLTTLPSGLAEAYAEARTILQNIVLPPDLSGQKKAGKCLLPQGVCFVKSSLAILERV